VEPVRRESTREQIYSFSPQGGGSEGIARGGVEEKKKNLDSAKLFTLPGIKGKAYGYKLEGDPKKKRRGSPATDAQCTAIVSIITDKNLAGDHWSGLG